MQKQNIPVRVVEKQEGVELAGNKANRFSLTEYSRGGTPKENRRVPLVEKDAGNASDSMTRHGDNLSKCDTPLCADCCWLKQQKTKQTRKYVTASQN